MNHYQLVKVDDSWIEIYEYGPICPRMSQGESYSNKKLLARLPLKAEVEWKNNIDGASYYFLKKESPKALAWG